MEPTLSQASANSASQQTIPNTIFTDPSSHRSLRVFVEANVLDRINVVRKLRRGGATIRDAAEAADIIVIDPDTQSAAYFLSEWGMDRGKTIVNHHWVNRSFERKRAYLGDEGWGKMKANSDNVDLPESQLPTPRTTPSDGSALTNDPENQPNGGGHYTLGQVQIQGQPVPTGQVFSDSDRLDKVEQLIFALANHQAPVLIQPNHPGIQAQPQYGQQIPQHYPMQQPIIYAQPQAYGGVLPQHAPHIQGLAPHMNPSHTAQEPQLHAYTYPSASHHNNGPDFHGSPPASQGPEHSSKGRPTSTEGPSRHKGRPSVSEERPAKHRRFSQLDDQEGQEDYRPRNRRRSSQHGKLLFERKPGSPYRFYVQVNLRDRTALVTKIKAHGGMMIPDINNADFVILQPDSSSYKLLIQQTNHVGKTAVRSKWINECIEQGEIVDFAEFTLHSGHVKTKRGRPARPDLFNNTRYVDDEEDQSDEEEDESESEEAKPRSKGKTRVLAKSSSKKGPLMKKDPVFKKDRASTTPQPKVASTSKGLGKRKARETSLPDPRWTPSPPPPDRPVKHSNGKTEVKNNYTPEERAYFETYVGILLNREPDCTYTSMCEKLFRKMPQHSKQSWSTYMSKPQHKSLVEALRKKAYIAYRKAGRDRPPSASVEPPTQSPPPSAWGAPSPQSKPKQTDFEIISRFFAEGGADNLGDDEVWGEMARLHPSRTADSWSDYWNSNGESIVQEVNRLRTLIHTGVKTE